MIPTSLHCHRSLFFDDHCGPASRIQVSARSRLYHITRRWGKPIALADSCRRGRRRARLGNTLQYWDSSLHGSLEGPLA